MTECPTAVMLDPLSDCSPLISAASSGKLRLVRLLVEGGAEVNGRNPKGETALLAACKALRGEPAGPETIKLLTYLLQNKVSPQWQIVTIKYRHLNVNMCIQVQQFIDLGVFLMHKKLYLL